jgi:hypothetical protein
VDLSQLTDSPQIVDSSLAVNQSESISASECENQSDTPEDAAQTTCASVTAEDSSLDESDTSIEDEGRRQLLSSVNRKRLNVGIIVVSVFAGCAGFYFLIRSLEPRLPKTIQKLLLYLRRLFMDGYLRLSIEAFFPALVYAFTMLRKQGQVS